MLLLRTPTSDGGYLASGWALHLAQNKLTRLGKQEGITIALPRSWSTAVISDMKAIGTINRLITELGRIIGVWHPDTALLPIRNHVSRFVSRPFLAYEAHMTAVLTRQT